MSQFQRFYKFACCWYLIKWMFYFATLFYFFYFFLFDYEFNVIFY